MKWLVLLLLAVLTGWVGYRVKSMFDLGKTYELNNNDLCQRHSYPYQIEDFVRFDDVLIGGAANLVDLFIDPKKGPELTTDGWLVSIVPSPFTTTKIEIAGWPHGVGFNPLGMSLYNKSTLVVVNLAYHKGGMRLEYIKLTKVNGEVKAKYLKSVHFGEEFQGIVNSVAQVSDKDFYMNTWHPFPDDVSGRAHDVLSTLRRVFYWTFMRTTYLNHCIEVDGKAQCRPVYSGRIMNGMDIAGDLLYVADGGDNLVLEYRVEKDASLTLLAEITVDLNPDNVAVGPAGEVYATGPILMTEVFQRFSGGNNSITTSVAKLEKQGGVWVSTNIYSQNVVSGASVATPIGDYLVLGTFEDTAIGVCKKI